jgi:hypothetical protein
MVSDTVGVTVDELVVTSTTTTTTTTTITITTDGGELPLSEEIIYIALGAIAVVIVLICGASKKR